MSGDLPITGNDTIAPPLEAPREDFSTPGQSFGELSLKDVRSLTKAETHTPGPDWKSRTVEEVRPADILITDPFMDGVRVSGDYETQDGKTVITLKTKDNTFEPPILLDKSGKLIEPIGGGGGGGGGDGKSPPPPPEDSVEYADGSRISYIEGESKLSYTDPAGKTSEIELNEPLVERR